MKSRSNLRILTFAGILLLFLMACSLPFITTSDKPEPAKSPGEPSAQPTAKTSPGKPTFTPTKKVSSNESTSPPTEPLPPLPDFDQVLTFGGGGAGFFCEELGYSESPNTVSVSVTYGQYAHLCMTLWGLDFGQPFRIELIAPDGGVFQSPNLWVDQDTNSVQWEGYPGFENVAERTSDGTFFLEINIWWPFTFPSGQWQVIAHGEGFQAYGDFWVAEESQRPYIAAFDPRAGYEIMPAWAGPASHPLTSKDNGAVDLIGRDFPTNTPVYVLLYLDDASDSSDYVLVHKQVVLSNPDGSIAVELPVPFEPGLTYLVYGITDPNTILGGTDFVNCYLALEFTPGAACDYFKAMPSTSVSTFPVPPSSSSCPGAPPQRMITTQRGYVCTQEVSVRLRDAPARSASTIVQLPTGSQFTVIEGPSCADNWSWWLIEADNGFVGWIAEGGDNVDPYFICPLP